MMSGRHGLHVLSNDNVQDRPDGTKGTNLSATLVLRLRAAVVAWRWHWGLQGQLLDEVPHKTQHLQCFRQLTCTWQSRSPVSPSASPAGLPGRNKNWFHLQPLYCSWVCWHVTEDAKGVVKKCSSQSVLAYTAHSEHFMVNRMLDSPRLSTCMTFGWWCDTN